jgi:hypothetical protein
MRIRGIGGKIISYEPNNGQLIHDGGTKTGLNEKTSTMERHFGTLTRH